MNKNFTNFKQVISYTIDRIYCAGECHGRFNEEIDKVIIKLREYVETDVEYDPLKDIDEDGNNPLHLTSKYGIYEFFDILCKHNSFNELKNIPNNKNETPLDLVKFRMYDSALIINPSLHFNISMWATKPYYSKSFPKLEKIMIEHGCVSNFSLTDMIISKANENLEKLTNEEYIREQAVKMVEMMKIFDTPLFGGKVKSGSDLLNMCLEDQYEKDQIKIKNYIDSFKKQNKSTVEYLRSLISSLKILPPSNEINLFDDFLKFNQSS